MKINNSFVDSSLNNVHKNIAKFLWHEPNDKYEIEYHIFNKKQINKKKSNSIDNLLSDLIQQNWVVIKYNLYCLTPLGRKSLNQLVH